MPKVTTSTQKYVPIYSIRDDVVIMKDGTLRSVLITSSINFMLKSEQEQNAVISSYVSFLNSFNFPVQIVIQSRRLNIDDYMNRLKKVEAEQTNELLRQQTKAYRDYVAELVDLGDIMSKKFYVVVPYNPSSDAPKGFFERIQEAISLPVTVKLSKKRFLQRKKELMQRTDIILTGLRGMGLNPIMLNTQSLIELYRNSYNLDISERQSLVDLDKLRVEDENPLK